MFGRTHFRLKVWNVKTGRQLRSLAGHGYVDTPTPNGAEYAVNGVAITRDGRWVVSASDDKTLKVWDVKTGRELRTLAGHADVVNGVAVSGDGRRAVSASQDQTLKVWDLETGRELHTLTGHTREVKSVAMSGDGQRAVSVAYYDPLKVWDLETGRELRTLAGHSDVVQLRGGECRRAAGGVRF
jgi:WD40 repeat protein